MALAELQAEGLSGGACGGVRVVAPTTTSSFLREDFHSPRRAVQRMAYRSLLGEAAVAATDALISDTTKVRPSVW